MPLGISVLRPPAKNAQVREFLALKSSGHICICAGKAGYVTMLITRIELENIKSYRRIAVDFRRGTTAICGANGAGKTTLVEAIGFALFDYLPYKQDQFVREGEKYGKIAVHLIGSDDRPYTVERRCGSGSRWFIYDAEADSSVDQRADVLDKLHDLFGIERERPLDSLFRDALGVPQGTFTSIFLEAASKRKQTFDALLQIEDYKIAADYLLDSQKLYKEQAQSQQSEIRRLEYETRDLDNWRSQLKAARLIDEEQTQQNELWTLQLVRDRERAVFLTEQANQLEYLRQRHDQSKAKYEFEQKTLLNHEQLLQKARAAQQIVQASREHHQQYRQASETLERLRLDERQRNTLRNRQAQFSNTLATIQAKLQNLQGRLQEVVVARQEIVALAPLVEQQIELEKQRDDLMQRVTRYDSIVLEGKKLGKTRDQYVLKQTELERKIVTIEPLQPLADKVNERNEALTQLRIQGNERKNKQRQLQEKRNALNEKLLERDQTADKLRKAEHNVSVIEEHRSEAEEMPVLQEQYMQLSTQVSRFEGTIEGYTKSRAQSAGGQCPLLHESCLNIKGRGIVSLESYFENLLTEEQMLLADIRRQQNQLTGQMGQIKKYADALGKLGLYIERRDMHAEHLQHMANDIASLEREVAELTAELDGLKQVEQQIAEADNAYKESKNAEAKVRELDGLRKQVQQYLEQILQCEADLEERRRAASELSGSKAQLDQVKVELAQLNDPRSRSKTQLSIVAQEDQFTQQLQSEQQKRLEIETLVQDLQTQLAAYATLDTDIAQQEIIQRSSYNGYQNYLQHQNEAQTLPDREQVYQQQAQITGQAAQTLQSAEHDYSGARAAFNADELKTVSAEIERLNGALAALATAMKHQQDKINALEQQIEQAEKLLILLEEARKEHSTLEDLYTMMEQFRRLIKEAAPYVLKAMLNDISAQANRIFGEIMGDHAAELSWENDYEVVLHRRGVKRTFAQLSGGEQMSAALAIRLALLKKLSTLNVAFFDEPTQNMDELRRMNLAEQIRRVRGFDQLVVISHDDTFEQGLDSIVRLKKESGETRILGDDEAIQRGMPEMNMWNQNDVTVTDTAQIAQ
jgi:DNA repair protein SbcC/Rad50